jgi:hypothetical protein
MRHFLTAAALCTALLGTANAGSAGALSLSRVASTTGVELSLGTSFLSTNAYIAPSAGLFVYHQPNSRYENDVDKNGREHCRDKSNGQFSSKSNCTDVGVRLFATLESGLRFGSEGLLGVGVRTDGRQTSPYVAVGWKPLRVVAGKDYVAVGVGRVF